ncbi:hypothetical protein A3F64_00770 [Candidatus Saccharibacteria bacterium RIFCSPHIGHO2_12_FULL_42_8]|jgi:hypothetical protein|nr:MAG: hypothetical protein A3F64_00770 [Candidatus Saccharibacteria bacterium RIFCSPHIGHO2_12_FULL_42_8]
MSTNNTQQETQEEIELRMKIIQEAMAEAQKQGSQTFSANNINMDALVDPQEGLICDGCE